MTRSDSDSTPFELLVPFSLICRQSRGPDGVCSGLSIEGAAWALVDAATGRYEQPPRQLTGQDLELARLIEQVDKSLAGRNCLLVTCGPEPLRQNLHPLAVVSKLELAAHWARYVDLSKELATCCLGTCLAVPNSTGACCCVSEQQPISELETATTRPTAVPPSSSASSSCSSSSSSSAYVSLAASESDSLAASLAASIGRLLERLIDEGHQFVRIEQIRRRVEVGFCERPSGRQLDHKVVRARGLPWQATEQDIADFFAGLNIAKGGVGLCLSRQGRRNGEALIQFESREQRDLALARHKHFMGVRYIEVYRASGDDFLSVAAAYSNRAQAFLSRGAQVIVRMRGLPFSCTAKQIVEFFAHDNIEVLGKEEGILIVRNQDDKPNGDAFVSFSNDDLLQRALAKHKQNIGSRYVELFRSTISEVQQVMSASRAPEIPADMQPSDGPSSNLIRSRKSATSSVTDTESPLLVNSLPVGELATKLASLSLPGQRAAARSYAQAANPIVVPSKLSQWSADTSDGASSDYKTPGGTQAPKMDNNEASGDQTDAITPKTQVQTESVRSGSPQIPLESPTDNTPSPANTSSSPTVVTASSSHNSRHSPRSTTSRRSAGQQATPMAHQQRATLSSATLPTAQLPHHHHNHHHHHHSHYTQAMAASHYPPSGAYHPAAHFYAYAPPAVPPGAYHHQMLAGAHQPEALTTASSPTASPSELHQASAGPVAAQAMIPTGSGRRDCVRLRGLPFEAHVEDVLAFFADHSKHILYQGIHMVLGPHGQSSGEAIIQLDSVQAAQSVAHLFHRKVMSVGKKQRYIEVIPCSIDDVLLGGLARHSHGQAHHHHHHAYRHAHAQMMGYQHSAYIASGGPRQTIPLGTTYQPEHYGPPVAVIEHQQHQQQSQAELGDNVPASPSSSSGAAESPSASSASDSGTSTSSATSHEPQLEQQQQQPTQAAAQQQQHHMMHAAAASLMPSAAYYPILYYYHPQQLLAAPYH